MPTYTDLSQVKRVLRSSSGEKVRFSDSLVDVTTGKQGAGGKLVPTIDIEFNYSLVQTGSSFDGDYLLKFLFSDSENFKALQVDQKIRRELLLSTGSVNSDYSTPDGLITVPAACWGGTIETDSVVQLRFDSHMSDDDANQYIEDAEAIIDAMIENEGVNYVVNGNTRVFQVGSVPEQVKVATTYLTAYMIFTDTFADFYKDKDEVRYSFIGRWKKRAEDLLKDYMRAAGRRPPKVLAFPSFIDKFGDPDVGPGVATWSTDYDTVTRDAESEDIFDP